ncbi:uncharacterized protein BJ212DRAFT_1382187 [Suillus subaureus]|uniref:Uncharacterized protein n=1 Tax=Suillus subaureus TaxID=48587 RepID=A0A9P7J8N7_9AGAM|nr:uncharacterized protein BJ212DRAFT_1382187 [Suillus subaureus]KAG1808633.1 hypothetical protein BJ212DRAFT_1382187 [Suillus subaureus]
MKGLRIFVNDEPQSAHTLELLRASYACFMYKMGSKTGKPVCRKCARMHTRPEHGLDVALAHELQKLFAWIPPLTADSGDIPDILDSGIIDLSELERVDKCIMPAGFVEEIEVLN